MPPKSLSTFFLGSAVATRNGLHIQTAVRTVAPRIQTPAKKRHPLSAQTPVELRTVSDEQGKLYFSSIRQLLMFVN